MVANTIEASTTRQLGKLEEWLKTISSGTTGAVDGFDTLVQFTPSIVTSVQGIVKVTTAYWSIVIGEGG